MFPFIFIFSLLILLSFFLNLYLTLKLILIFYFICFLFIFFINKNHAIIFLIISILALFFNNYKLNNNFNLHKIIVQSKKFKGIIINKKELDKKYMYFIDLYSCVYNNKQEKISENILIISKKNLSIGEFVFIPYAFFMQKHSSIDKFKKNLINLSIPNIGITQNIKVNHFVNYEKVYQLLNFLFKLKDSFYDSLKIYFEEQNKFFFDTIFLGKTVRNKKYRNLFFIWGISHYLARSGLHIQICITILISFFLFLGFSYSISAIFQLFILFLFYFFTFFSISFFRAFLMYLFFLICKLLKIPTTSLHTLSAATIITFFMYPFAFLQIGTQLTFFTTFILSLISYRKSFINKRHQGKYTK